MSRRRIVGPETHHEKIVSGRRGRDGWLGWQRAVEHVEEAHVLREPEALVVWETDGVHGG